MINAPSVSSRKLSGSLNLSYIKSGKKAATFKSIILPTNSATRQVISNYFLTFGLNSFSVSYSSGRPAPPKLDLDSMISL